MNLDIRSSRWNLANHLLQYVWFSIHIQWGQPFIMICMVCYTHTVRPTIYYDMYGLLYTYSGANHFLWYLWFAIHIQWGQPFITICMVCYTHEVRPTIYYDNYGLLYTYSDKVMIKSSLQPLHVFVNSNSYSRSIVENVQYCDSWTRSYNCIHFPVL